MWTNMEIEKGEQVRRIEELKEQADKEMIMILNKKNIEEKSKTKKRRMGIRNQRGAL